MDNKGVNRLAIVGLILSFIISIGGLMVSYIAMKQIIETKEKGMGIAKTGLIISIIKLGLILLVIILLMIGINNLNESDIDEPLKSNSNNYKCSKATNCKYNSKEGTYSCIYFNQDDGVEEYITCNSDGKVEAFTTTAKDTSKDDEDYDDTFDYDREDVVPSEE